MLLTQNNIEIPGTSLSGGYRPADMEYIQCISAKWLVKENDMVRKNDVLAEFTYRKICLPDTGKAGDEAKKTWDNFHSLQEDTLLAYAAKNEIFYGKSEDVLLFDSDGVCKQFPLIHGEMGSGQLVAPHSGIFTPLVDFAKFDISTLRLLTTPPAVSRRDNSFSSTHLYFLGQIMDAEANEPDQHVINTLYIVYDTSYLMSAIPEENECILNFICFEGYHYDNMKCHKVIDLIHVVGEEVKKEIAGNMKDEAKGQSASRARLVCSSIFADHKYINVEFSDAPPYEIIEPLLGPDSTTDKQLLAWAFSAASTPGVAVYVATKDGGLLNEICRSYRERKTRVFCSNIRRSLEKLFDYTGESFIQQYMRDNKSSLFQQWETNDPIFEFTTQGAKDLKQKEFDRKYNIIRNR